MASIYAISFPVPTGDVVKQGHADYCRDNGHATWEEDGVDKGVCPRCGTVTRGYEPEATPAPVEVVATFQVCVDCMQWVAGIDEHERGEAYPAAVTAAMTAPDAAGWRLVNTCGDDVETGHEYTCTSFTYAPCDTCATWLGGERHAVAVLSR